MLLLLLAGLATIAVALILEGMLAPGLARGFVLMTLFSIGACLIAIGLWAIPSPLAASLAGFGVFLPFWGPVVMFESMVQGSPNITAVLVLVVLAVSVGLAACAAGALKQKFRPLLAQGLPRNVAGFYPGAILVTLMALAAMLLATGTLVHHHGKGAKLNADVLAWMGLIAALGALIAAAACWRQLKHSLRRFGRFWWYPVAICGGLGSAMLAGAYARSIEGSVPPEIIQAMTIFNASDDWGVLVVWIAVVPAITEELLFRGAMMGAFRGVMGPGKALLVTSLMFMGMHATPMVFPVVLTMGFVLGYMRLRSGSIYPCILMHFVHNAAVLFAELLAR
jgi:membrane protease YdiL (CAAX protease family)